MKSKLKIAFANHCDAVCGELGFRPVERPRSAALSGRCGVIFRLLGLALLATGIACQTPGAPLEVVKEVDLERYMGRWYEIASFPQHFQRGCVATTATYEIREDGRISVENECRDGSFDGELRRAEGVAWASDPAGSSAKLQVQFFWPFSGDYWVIDLDSDYRYAVIGHPSRRYLWILAREPTLDPEVYAKLRSRIAAKGYDLDRLNETPQPAIRGETP